MISPASWSLFSIVKIRWRMFFLKKRKAQIAIFVIALVAFLPGFYMAQAGTTTSLQFVVNAYTGGLSISVPATGDLGSLAQPETATVVIGQLDTVTVTDTRRAIDSGLTRTWTAFAISTDLLTGSDSLTASSIGYSAGTPIIVSGQAAVTEHTATNLHTSIGVQSGSTTTGNHVVSWRPTLRITVRSSQTAGTYTGILTHSVA
jgi:hypothetical protein